MTTDDVREKAVSDELADQVLAECKRAGILISPYRAEPGEALSQEDWIAFRRDAIRFISLSAAPAPDPERVMDALKLALAEPLDFHTKRADHIMQAVRAALAPASDRSDG